MKQRGLIGQFNHPDVSGQFMNNGTSLGYNADADEVMVLSEILNTAGKDYDLYLVNSSGTTVASSLGATTNESLT
jgi:hypothetical protein